MSSLHPSDKKFHYSDNSHRWVAPHLVKQETWTEEERVQQKSWEAEVAAHIDQHRQEFRTEAKRPEKQPNACNTRFSG